MKLFSYTIAMILFTSSIAMSKESHDSRAYIGAHGFVNGSFISEPKSKTLNINNLTYQLPYPGFGGVGGGGGGVLGVAWKALSLDIGFDWSVDSAEGRIDGFTYTMSQTTQHIPLTIRAEVPNLTVRPSLLLGVDWVSTSKTSLEKPSGFVVNPPLLEPNKESYTAWRFGFGFDFMLSDRLRLPLRILAIYAPIDRSDLSEYIIVESGPSGVTTGFKYRSQWEWQPQITLGLSYDFQVF